MIEDFTISILIAISKYFNHSELIQRFDLDMYWFNHIYDCQSNFKIIIIVPSKSLNVKNNPFMIEYTYFLHSIDIFTFRVINVIIVIKLLLWLAIFKSNDWIIYRFHGISIPFHPSCFHKPYLVSSNPNIPLILGTLDKPTSLND